MTALMRGSWSERAWRSYLQPWPHSADAACSRAIYKPRAVWRPAHGTSMIGGPEGLSSVPEIADEATGQLQRDDATLMHYQVGT